MTLEELSKFLISCWMFSAISFVMMLARHESTIETSWDSDFVSSFLKSEVHMKSNSWFDSRFSDAIWKPILRAWKLSLLMHSRMWKLANLMSSPSCRNYEMKKFSQIFISKSYENELLQSCRLNLHVIIPQLFLNIRLDFIDVSSHICHFCVPRALYDIS